MEIVTTSDSPDLDHRTLSAGWPRSIPHDSVSDTHRDAVTRYFPRFDVLLVDRGGVLVGSIRPVSPKWR
ncbi:MAG TPA: hypothetical protein VFX16_02840 [Pseudonocardiaceae bacterium]|nr:hypothetical protein [Pseudonocardiaceae bacterium]